MSRIVNARSVIHQRFLIVGLLLISALLRQYGLNNLSPPGLEHDEVAHWLINQDILEGEHAVYFMEAYGHEAGFHYVQTIFTLLLGDNTLALRLPSAFAGMLLVSVCFALTRRLFDRQTAFWSAALLAVLFWPVFYSRLALRAISLPLLSGLSAYYWWRGWQFAGEKARIKYRQSFLLAGFLAGLSAYSYMASRAVPIFYISFAGYLFLFHRPAFKRHLSGIFLFFLVYAIVATPLVTYLLSFPGAESRLNEINAPLEALLNGQLRPAAENTVRFLGMFGLEGDPLWRQNVAYLPVFEPVVAVFFYIGLLISLWRWREPRYLFLVLWLFSSAIPSIVTIDAPSSIRIINALPVVTVFPLIGTQVIPFFRRLSTVFNKLSPNLIRNSGLLVMFAIFCFYIGRTTKALFQTWPSNSEVQFVWQQAMTDAARYLDQLPDDRPVAIGGWTPETMDPPTMELTLVREDLNLRYFNPTNSLIIPAQEVGAIKATQSGLIIRPTILPLDPYLEEQLATWNIKPHPMGSFTLYTIAENWSPPSGSKTAIPFGDQLTFLGYEVSQNCLTNLQVSTISASLIKAEPDCEIFTHWRIETKQDEQRSFFLHFLDENGQVLAQDDGLDAPAAYWQPGDHLIQRHTLEIPAVEGKKELHLGVYNPSTAVRLTTVDGADFIALIASEAAP